MRSLSPTCCVLVLLVLLVSLVPSPALAEGPARSVNYKTFFKEVSRLYEDLEYERALEVLGRAEREAEIPREDRLWLLMMRGVLHYVLKQQAEADAAFRRLLEQEPESRITLRSASKTLKDHFDRLREQVLREQALAKVEAQAPPTQKQEPEPPTVDTMSTDAESPTVTSAPEEVAPATKPEALPPVEPRPTVPPPAATQPAVQPVPVPASEPAATVSAGNASPLLLYPRLGVRAERELLANGFAPALKTELILGTTERPWIGFMLMTVIQPSSLLRGELRAYPLDIRLSTAVALGAYLSMGATAHPANWAWAGAGPEAWAGRGGGGLSLQLHSWRLSVDLNYERFLMSRVGWQKEAVLLAVEIDTGLFSP